MRHRVRLSRIIGFRAVLVASLAVAITACGSGAESSRPGANSAGPTPGLGALKVVTTTTVFADIVQNVGGSRVAATSIIPPGVGPEDYEPKPDDARRLADARLIVSNGVGLDDFLDDLLASGTGGETPHLVLGDMLPNRNVADADVPYALAWLELMARLGFLKKNENWCRLYDRFLDDRDADGVWHPHKGMAAPRSTNPFLWATYPLEDHMTGDDRWTDLTFRLGLIGRLLGRTIEVV